MVQKRKREEKNCKKFSSKQKYIIVIAWICIYIYTYTQYSRTKKKKEKKNFKGEFVENEIELFRVNGD